ncbi:DUF2637 domain-containing protein [Sciscionella marina]|uniref:DUF2637 domain-containing protein n=1 Tax=Sciscionella marina TaxID=508770 RepID=UPI00037831FE|nr:DUF2637 domain-containing protein [Sciscionella marina]
MSLPRTGHSLSLWIQCTCTALVALGAAYASFRHGREFALRFGADTTTATIWPLIVDGLVITATVELWKPRGPQDGQRWAAWLAFTLGIGLSLTANIAASPTPSVCGVAVAACPPLALLLAVELLNRALKRHRMNVEAISPELPPPEPTEKAAVPADSADTSTATTSDAASAQPSAEQRMWDYYLTQHARGRTPTGAELDRHAGTNNYGRRVLRQWRTKGILLSLQASQPTRSNPLAPRPT